MTGARKANAGTNLPHILVPGADRANSRFGLGVGWVEQARLNTWFMMAPLVPRIENNRLQLFLDKECTLIYMFISFAAGVTQWRIFQSFSVGGHGNPQGFRILGWTKQAGGAKWTASSRVQRAGVVDSDARKAGKHRRHRVRLLSEHLILTPIRDSREIVPAPESCHEVCNRRSNLRRTSDVYQVRFAIS